MKSLIRLGFFSMLALTTVAAAQAPTPPSGSDTTRVAPPALRDSSALRDSVARDTVGMGRRIAPPGRSAADTLGARAGASPARPFGESHPGLGGVRARAATVDAAERRATEPQLDSLRAAIDAHADSVGGDTLSLRLRREFGSLADSAEVWRSRTGLGWGELVIATTLAANAPDSLRLSVLDLAALRNEGLGWGAIAHGMGYSLGSLVSAARTEALTATGVNPADGRVARIGAAAPKSATPGKATTKTKSRGTTRNNR